VGLHTVVAVTHPDNTASQAVCNRIGMEHLGQTDRYYNTVCELFSASSENHQTLPTARLNGRAKFVRPTA